MFGHQCWFVIFGIKPTIVLFMNGGNADLYCSDKAKSPAYLGSSFAFLHRRGVVTSKMGYPYALGGFVAVDFVDVSCSFVFTNVERSGSILCFRRQLWARCCADRTGISSSAAVTGLLEDKIDPKRMYLYLQ